MVNDPWAAMDALMKEESEPTGPEWFTRLDYRVRYGLSDTAARRRLEPLVKNGTLEQWKGNSKGCVVVKYRFA